MFARPYLAFLLFSVLAAAALSPADTAAISSGDGTCNATAVTWAATDSAGATLKPANWTNVPGATVTFVQGSTKGGIGGASCVVVRYTATVSGATLRASLDNSTVAIPGSTGAGPGTREFVFPRVTPGTHTITMQVKGQFSGQTVTVADQVLVVQHAP